MGKSMSEILQRVAMKAVIVNKGRVLILREARTYDEGTQSGRYHLPGGRLEAGEKFEEGLRREVKEETGLAIDIEYPVLVGEWFPMIKGVKNQIIGIYLACKSKTTDVVLSNEHDKFEWISPSDRVKYDIMDPEGNVIDRYAELTSQ